MIGFPFDYGDELSDEESFTNLKDFIKTYAIYILIIGLRSLPSGAVDTVPDKVAPTTTSTPNGVEVAKPPTLERVVGNKGLQGAAAGAFCANAVSSGNPVVGFTCGALFYEL